MLHEARALSLLEIHRERRMFEKAFLQVLHGARTEVLEPSL